MSEDKVAAVGEWLTNAAKLGDVQGVTLRVDFEDGSELRKQFGDVEVGAISTPKGSDETDDTPEGGEDTSEGGATDEASLRDKWQKLASDDWNKFQKAAAEHGVTEGDGPTRISTLVEMGATPEGGEVEVENTDGESPERSFAQLSESEQDDLRSSYEDDPEVHYKEVKDLLKTGEDYTAFGGECPAEHHDSAIGRNVTKNGILPFCSSCAKKSSGFTLTILDEGQNDIFATLIEGGKEPIEAFEAVEA